MAVIIRTDYRLLSSGAETFIFSVEVDSIVQVLELAPGNRFIIFNYNRNEWMVCHMHDGAGNAPDMSGDVPEGESYKGLLQELISEVEETGVAQDVEIFVKFMEAMKSAQTTDVSSHPSFGEAIREAIRGLITEYGDKPASPLRAEEIEEVDEWLSENAQPTGVATWVTKDSTSGIMPSDVMTMQEMSERIKRIEQKILD